MKLQFKGSEGFESYQGHMGIWGDGEVKEVPENIGKHLLESMPEHFSSHTEKADFPKHDRVAKPKRNK